jgi:hypothetical protein
MNTFSDPENDGQSEKRKSTRNSSDRSLRMEEEIARIAKDESLKARELVLMKKEISRLHYKVKAYHSQNRILNIVFNIITISLLLVIAFRLYDSEIPQVKIK